MIALSRGITGALALSLGLLITLACAPAATPTPTTAPKPTTAAPAAQQSPTAATNAPSPAAATPAATRPAATSSPAAKADSGWQQEWDAVVAAAKKEGKVAVGGARGDGFDKASAGFHKAYPDIDLEYTPMAGRDLSTRVLAERQAGQYLWDAYLGGTGTLHTVMIPNKALAPLKPNLILPEVLDSSKWRGGFDDGWTDLGAQYVYAFMGYVNYSTIVNRDLAPASQLKTLDDLLDPRWKGLIAWQDPRDAGSGSMSGGLMLATKGEDFYRKLLSNDIVVLKDTRMILEGLARGKYAVAVGYRQPELVSFKKEGLLSNVEVLDPNGPGGSQLIGGSANLAAIDRPAHPNAAKVFLNWVLSKAGQEVYVQETGLHSRRLDVPLAADPDNAPQPGVTYMNLQKENVADKYDRGIEIAKEIIKN